MGAQRLLLRRTAAEKKVATDSTGNFSIELANGDCDVTIKKTGSFTVEKKVTISDADLEALNFTMETNPVSMPSG